MSGFTQRQTTTDSNGDYSFTNVPLGNNYTVTPSKTGGANNITAFDASLAARFPLGSVSLTPNQQVAADTSNNGSVTAFDASQIARFPLNIPAPGSLAGTWKFSPVNQSVPNLSGNQTNVNLTAILVGDVSGNWVPTSPQKSTRAVPNVTIPVSLPIKQDPPGTSTISVVVGDTTGQGVFAYDFDMSFDPAVLQLQSPAFDTSGTLSSGWAVNTNSNTDGSGRVHLTLNAFNTSAMSGQGVLVKLKFNVIGSTGANTSLLWHSFNFNEGTPADPSDNDINGSFTVGSPSANSSRISGQILSPSGQPVAGAVVTVLGTDRVLRVITDSNGFYKVEGMETGGFYTLVPNRANFTFAPSQRAFSLIADMTDAVFTGTGIPRDDANPLETPEFFVRQQYLDFLGREPEQGGLDFWSGQLRACGNDGECLRQRRLDVSAAFFIAQEFQDSGLYLYDLYEGGLGRRPDYAEYAADRPLVVGGPQLETEKEAFAARFVERAEFTALYPLTMSGEVFVDALLQRAGQRSGLDLTEERARLLTIYESGQSVNASRSAVLRAVVESEQFRATQYNSGFVLAEYFSYLGRNPDHAVA